MLALCAAHVETDTAYCTGWRKIEYWRKHMKNNMLKLSRTTADKSKNRGERIKKASDEYLHTARSLSVKLSNVKQLNSLDLVEGIMLKQLAYYREMLDTCAARSASKHTAYFVFTAYFVRSTSMPFGYTVQVDRIRKYYEKISSCSSDKGFFSKIDVEILELFEIKAIIPKKGKRSLVDLQKENDPKFIKAKRSHSAVESNINELEHRGLDRCPDRGIKGMHRYVGLSVIAYFVLRTKYKYNLRRIGQILLEKDRKEAEKATKLRQAA